VGRLKNVEVKAYDSRCQPNEILNLAPESEKSATCLLFVKLAIAALGRLGSKCI